MEFSDITLLLLTHHSFVLWYNLSLLCHLCAIPHFLLQFLSSGGLPSVWFYKICLSSVVHLFMKMSHALILCFCVVWTVKVGLIAGLLCDVKREHIKYAIISSQFALHSIEMNGLDCAKAIHGNKWIKFFVALQECEQCPGVSLDVSAKCNNTH